MGSRGNSVSILTRFRAGQMGFDSQQELEFFSAPPRQDRLWDPPSLLSSGRRGVLFSREKLTGRESDHSHLHLVPRLRIRGAIRPRSSTRVYPKVSGLAAWSENCKWYGSLPIGAVVSLFYESV
jgi:hypothetical protein